jgi:hypothetical protein
MGPVATVHTKVKMPATLNTVSQLNGNQASLLFNIATVIQIKECGNYNFE